MNFTDSGFSKWTLIKPTQKDANGEAIGDRLSFPMPDETVASLKYVGRDTCTKGLDYTLKQNAGFTNYSYPGYTFNGWKVVSETVSPNPTGFFARLFSAFMKRTFAVGTVYSEGDTIPALSSNITVEAVWTENATEPQKFHVTYDGNGATDGEVPTDSNEYEENATPEVRGQNTLVKTDCEFKGWNTAADGSGSHYIEGQKLPGMTADVTLYAEWESAVHEPDPEPEKYRVTYNGNGSTGGNVPEDKVEYSSGNKVTVLSQGDLAKDGYTFKGWNTTSDGHGTTYQPPDKFKITGNVTLYAVWTKEEEVPSKPGIPGIPGTGEGIWLIVLAGAALLLSCGAILTVLYRRRKK